MIKLDDWMIEGISLKPNIIDAVINGRMLNEPVVIEDWCRIQKEHSLNEICRKNNYLRINDPECIR